MTILGVLALLFAILARNRAEDVAESAAAERYPEVWARFIADIRASIGVTIGWAISVIGTLAAVVGGFLGLRRERALRLRAG